MATWDGTERRKRPRGLIERQLDALRWRVADKLHPRLDERPLPATPRTTR